MGDFPLPTSLSYYSINSVWSMHWKIIGELEQSSMLHFFTYTDLQIMHPFKRSIFRSAYTEEWQKKIY